MKISASSPARNECRTINIFRPSFPPLDGSRTAYSVPGENSAGVARMRPPLLPRPDAGTTTAIAWVGPCGSATSAASWSSASSSSRGCSSFEVAAILGVLTVIFASAWLHRRRARSLPVAEPGSRLYGSLERCGIGLMSASAKYRAGPGEMEQSSPSARRRPP